MIGSNLVKKLTPSGIDRLGQLQPQELIELLDEWVQWQDILAQQVMRLRQAFPQQLEILVELLSLLLKANQSRPSHIWLRRWSKAQEALSYSTMQELLLTLASVYTPEVHNQEYFNTLGEVHNQEYFDIFSREFSLRSEEFRKRKRVARNVTRGAIWALADFPEEEVYDLLTQTVLTWARSGDGNPTCGNAAIWTLHQLGDEAALCQLSDLRSRITHRALQRKIQGVLTELASQSGLTIDELSDQLVPNHGLNLQGERTWSIGDFKVGLQIASNGQVDQIVCDSEGKSRRSLPKRARETNSEIWQAILAEKRALAKTLKSQKNRLETAMVDGRRWSGSGWVKTFMGHPILGHLARRLVWEVFRADGIHITYALPQPDQTWKDALGKVAQIPSDGSLAIAHPIAMSPELHSAWQRYVVAQRLIQPFKQVFRETYVLTPVEIETYDYSNRFAAHQILSHYLYALTRSRGWSGTLGFTGFDGAGIGWRDFPAHDVRAYLHHQSAQYGDELVTLEQVSFQTLRLQDGQEQMYQPIPLQSIHPIAFSEAMRDIDLVVAVASVGTDADWQDWEAARRAGEVTWRQQEIEYENIAAATAQTRAELLQELIPTLGLTNQVRVEGRFVLIKGHRNQYRIHLGSGNIHLEPGGRYVCIVTQGNSQRLYLPFEENDSRTAEILSKTLLLVHDDKISDPSILNQLCDT